MDKIEILYDLENNNFFYITDIFYDYNDIYYITKTGYFLKKKFLVKINNCYRFFDNFNFFKKDNNSILYNFYNFKIVEINVVDILIFKYKNLYIFFNKKLFKIFNPFSLFKLDFKFFDFNLFFYNFIKLNYEKKLINNLKFLDFNFKFYYLIFSRNFNTILFYLFFYFFLNINLKNMVIFNIFKLSNNLYTKKRFKKNILGINTTNHLFFFFLKYF